MNLRVLLIYEFDFVFNYNVLRFNYIVIQVITDMEKLDKLTNLNTK